MPFRNPGLLVPTLLALAVAASAGDAPAPASTIEVKAERDGALTTSTAAAARLDLGEVAGGTDVIDAESYKKGRALTVRDMLGWAPGVYAQPRFGSEETRLSIRGSGIQRTFHTRGVMVLQDGFPLNTADGAVDLQAIEPATLDHVAVYRGANALRFGAATLGGALDFVTPIGRSAPLADLRMEGGSFGYVRALAATGGQRGDVDWYVSAGGYVQDGYRQHSRQENLRTTANVGWRMGDGLENRLYLAYADSESELPGSLTRAQYDADPRQAAPGNLTGDQHRDYPLLRVADALAWRSGGERLDAGVSYTWKDLFHPIFQVIDQESEDWAGNVRFTTDGNVAGHRNRLILGINAVYGTIDAQQFVNVGGQKGAQTIAADETATGFDLYGEDRFHLRDDLALIAGLQATWTTREYQDRFLTNGDQSGATHYNAVNPKVGVLWDASPRTQVFANLSRSYEPPSFSEMVTTLAANVPLVLDDIRAQHAWTAELGTRGSGDRVAWDLTLYHAWVRDELLSYQIAPNVQRTINADRTTHLGAEAGFDATVVHGLFTDDDELTLRQVYGWGRFRFAGDAVNGDNQIPGLPEHTWRVELQWSWEGWYGGPNLEWQSAYPVDFANTTDNDSYALLGWRVGYRTASGFSGFIEGRNLTDERHAPTTGIANPAQAVAGQALYLPGDGLSVYGGVGWRY